MYLNHTYMVKRILQVPTIDDVGEAAWYTRMMLGDGAQSPYILIEALLRDECHHNHNHYPLMAYGSTVDIAAHHLACDFRRVDWCSWGIEEIVVYVLQPNKGNLAYTICQRYRYDGYLPRPYDLGLLPTCVKGIDNRDTVSLLREAREIYIEQHPWAVEPPIDAETVASIDRAAHATQMWVTRHSIGRTA